MNSRWAMLAGVVLAAAVLVISLRSSAGRVQTIPITTWLACSACGHCYHGEIGDRPGRCSGCGKQALWPASQCHRCRAIVAMDIDAYNNEKREPYCRKCGGRRLVEIKGDSAGSRPEKQSRGSL